MDTLADDFLALPIIISDYDAILSSSSSPVSSPKPQPSHSSQGNSPQTPPPTQYFIDQTSSPSGFIFGDFADAWWKRMTVQMRRRLREACVEVLRRVDENDFEDEREREGEERGGFWDEDARLLD